MQPNVWFLMGTLLFTGVATAMLCVAIRTDHWEQVTWDDRKLDDIVVRKNGTQVKWVFEWLLDRQVGRIVYMNATDKRKDIDRKDTVTNIDSSGQEYEVAVFLIPMHGGIWTLCVSLTGKWTTISADTATLGGFWLTYIRVVNCIKLTCTISSPASPYSHKIRHSHNTDFYSLCVCGKYCGY
jgi:glycine cleavage system H lipoate-binding protein